MQAQAAVLCRMEVVLGHRRWMEGGGKLARPESFGEANQVRTKGRYGFSPSNLHPGVTGMWGRQATSGRWRVAVPRLSRVRVSALTCIYGSSAVRGSSLMQLSADSCHSVLCCSAPSKALEPGPGLLQKRRNQIFKSHLLEIAFVIVLPCHSVSVRLALRGSFSPREILHVIGSVNA